MRSDHYHFSHFEFFPVEIFHVTITTKIRKAFCGGSNSLGELPPDNYPLDNFPRQFPSRIITLSVTPPQTIPTQGNCPLDNFHLGQMPLGELP